MSQFIDVPGKGYIAIVKCCSAEGCARYYGTEEHQDERDFESTYWSDLTWKERSSGNVEKVASARSLRILLNRLLATGLFTQEQAEQAWKEFCEENPDLGLDPDEFTPGINVTEEFTKAPIRLPIKSDAVPSEH